jgi:hypothetical protein
VQSDRQRCRRILQALGTAEANMTLKACLGIAMGVMVWLGGSSGRVMAQGGIAKATSLRCSFSSQTKADWRADGSADISTGTGALTLRFEGIDTDAGTAELKTGSMTSELIVRASEGYLNFLQVFRTGPIYTTTVFDAGSRGGRFKAVHSRHEYLAPPLPGATSTPEQYYGECEIVL